ncbi:MAG: hypothetical protein P8N30_06505 [Tateyamaria sp.]|nr:hypothetical protein [Tateyamaria sp.]MDG1335156.1 hypothetical protein [Tateyamaria sp.]MDG2056409.1 hypothetical protein [Tateyamaria sp.]
MKRLLVAFTTNAVVVVGAKLILAQTLFRRQDRTINSGGRLYD